MDGEYVAVVSFVHHISSPSIISLAESEVRFGGIPSGIVSARPSLLRGVVEFLESDPEVTLRNPLIGRSADHVKSDPPVNWPSFSHGAVVRMKSVRALVPCDSLISRVVPEVKSDEPIARPSFSRGAGVAFKSARFVLPRDPLIGRSVQDVKCGPEFDRPSFSHGAVLEVKSAGSVTPCDLLTGRGVVRGVSIWAYNVTPRDPFNGRAEWRVKSGTTLIRPSFSRGTVHLVKSAAAVTPRDPPSPHSARGGEQ